MSPLIRHFVMVLICVSAALFLVIQFAAGVATHGITDTAKADSAEVARAVLTVLKPDLIAVLAAGPEEKSAQPAPVERRARVAQLIKSLQDSGMAARINLFDQHHRIVFSTTAAAIGEVQPGNDGIQRALQGNTVTRVVDPQGQHWSGTLPAGRTVVENYLPIVLADGAIAGVLEVYSSSGAVASNVKSSTRRLLVGGALACLVLFVALVWAAYRTGRSAERQRKASEARGRALRELSSRVMQWEEEDKARVSQQLHEGVCQSLSAIKYLLESAHRFVRDFEKAPESGILDPIIPSLQAAIRDTRAIAMELRPSGLEGTGLITTMHSLCREYESELKVRQRVAVQESEIPARLKPVILRIAQSILAIAAHKQGAKGVGWSLACRRNELQLWIQITPAEGNSPASSVRTAKAIEARDLEVACARVILSGGSARCLRDADSGKLILLAAWPIDGSADRGPRLRRVVSTLGAFAGVRPTPRDAVQPG